MGDGGKPPAYERWTDEDKQRLGALATTEDIDMSDTQYGHEMALKKRELEAAADNSVGRRETPCNRNGMQWM